MTLAHRTSRRAAISILETVVGAAMLAVALSAAAQTIAQFQRHAQATATRAAALVAVENLMEQLAALPWDDIDDERIRRLALPEALLAKAPRAQLAGSVAPVAEPVAAKRLTLSLTLGGPSPRPVTLATWIYRQPAQSPPPPAP